MILALLILIQSVTLVKLIRSGSFKEGIKITAMVLLANIASALLLVCNKKLLQPNLSFCWLVVYAVFTLIYFGLWNTSQWFFSFEYYNMVRIIPFVLDDIPPPESLLRSNIAQFWVWTILNIIVSFLTAVSIYLWLFFDLNGDNDASLKLQGYYFYCTIVFCFLSIISTAYLGLSIYRIKKLINEKELKVNTKLMILFATAFGLFLFGGLVNTIYLVIETFEGKDFSQIELSEFYIKNQLYIKLSSCLT